jgi:hypothetical protein
MIKIVAFFSVSLAMICFVGCQNPLAPVVLNPDDIHTVFTKNLNQLKADDNLVKLLAQEKARESTGHTSGQYYEKIQKQKEEQYKDIRNKIDFGPFVKAFLDNKKIVSNINGEISYEIDCDVLLNVASETFKQLRPQAHFDYAKSKQNCQNDPEVQAILKHNLLLRVTSLSKDVLRIGIVAANKEFGHFVVAPDKITAEGNLGTLMTEVWPIFNDDPSQKRDFGMDNNGLPDSMGTFTGKVQVVYEKGRITAKLPEGLKRVSKGADRETVFSMEASEAKLVFESAESVIALGSTTYTGEQGKVTFPKFECKIGPNGIKECTPDTLDMKTQYGNNSVNAQKAFEEIERWISFKPTAGRKHTYQQHHYDYRHNDFAGQEHNNAE